MDTTLKVTWYGIAFKVFSLYFLLGLDIFFGIFIEPVFSEKLSSEIETIYFFLLIG